MLIHLSPQPSRPKRVVVLGANGFVGSQIVDFLSEIGINVLGISRKVIDLLQSDAYQKLAELLQEGDVLIIVSAKAPCKDIDMFLQNVQMIKPFLLALEKITLSQVVYVSSDAIYADDVFLITEEAKAQPSSLHGMMHSARELMLQLALKNKVPLAILRPTLLYGENDPHNGYGPNRFRRLAMEDKQITLFGEGEEKRDHVYVRDVASIVNLVIQYRSQGTLNIATGQSHSFREIANYIYAILGKNPDIEGTPRQNPITHKHFDITVCNTAFPTFQYTPLEKGIAQVIANLEEHQYA